jgi:poly(ADP-ribose) glycohydrolase ARH3
MSLQSKFVGGLLGTALGDAIGELAFSAPSEAELRSKIAEVERLVYTDDTAMAIGLAESLLEVGRLDSQKLGDTLRANYEREPWRGYAIGPPTIFGLVARYKTPYLDAARSLFGGQGSFGNGAAMRIAPVGLFFHDSQDLYEQARLSAAVTHAHAIGIDGAAVLARAIAQAAALSPQDPLPVASFCQELIDFARTPEVQSKMTHVKHLALEQPPDHEAARRLGQSVAAHESMPFAVYAFVRYPHAFEACLLCATLNGGDRDTLGAMACAVSGAYLGSEAIPLPWQEKLENRQYIERLACDLAERAARDRATP